MTTVLWFLLLIAFGVYFFCLGYENGVNDTERRWSIAVARKEDRERTTP